MIILDTNVVSELMKPKPDVQVQNWLNATGSIVLTTTAITVSEIEYGLQRLPSGRRRDDLQHRFISLAGALSVQPFDDVAAFLAGQFRARREAVGLHLLHQI